MSKMYFGFFLVFVLFLTGCNTTSTATPPATASQTPIPEATNTSLPTATLQPVVPTFTPEPSLRTDGPFFSYFREVDGVYQLVMMDADGGGRRIVSLPEGFTDALPDKEYGLDMRFVSLDGKWLAFYTGYVGEMYSTGTDVEKYDLTLKLLDLATGNVQTITRLLSDDYPNNFEQASKKLNDPFITRMDLEYAFVTGITRAIAWSPDGRYLAFAGQMDGLSSDLYLYNVAEKSIHRLSSGDQELQWINWSPDGKWILHGSIYSVGEGVTDSLYAAAPDIKSIRSLSVGHFGGWFNSHSYFEYDSQNGLGKYGLRLVDINTGKITKIWDGSIHSYESDLSENWVVLSALLPDVNPYSHPEPDYNFVPGLYLVDMNNMKKTHIDYPPDEVVLDYEIIPVNSYGNIFFLACDYLPYTFFLTSAGEVKPYELGNAKVSFSPSSKYWIAVSGREIKIFSVDNNLLKIVPFTESIKPREFEITWTPVSLNFFIMQESSVYSIDILQGTSSLVETNLMQSYYDQEYLWIGGE